MRLRYFLFTTFWQQGYSSHVLGRPVSLNFSAESIFCAAAFVSSATLFAIVQFWNFSQNCNGNERRKEEAAAVNISLPFIRIRELFSLWIMILSSGEQSRRYYTSDRTRERRLKSSLSGIMKPRKDNCQSNNIASTSQERVSLNAIYIISRLQQSK